MNLAPLFRPIPLKPHQNSVEVSFGLRRLAPIPLHLLLFSGKFPPLSGKLDELSLGHTVFCLRCPPFAFPRPVETLLNTISHLAALLFSRPAGLKPPN